jgi:uncharacterized protein
MHLPNINVWLALTFGSHVHHAIAKAWFDGLPSEAVCFFCRLTQMGFLRLATNPRVFGNQAVTLHDAWLKYDIFLGDPRVSFAEELPNLEKHWRGFTQVQRFSPHVWNDAYLAGFAIASNLELVSFDKGFLQYANLTCFIL